jgi:anti-anti-sigma regulatory factor
MKKVKSRSVKRVSSTRGPKRPKQKVKKTVLETPKTMDPSSSEAIPAGALPVAGPATGRVVLPVSCTIKEADALKAHLLEQLERPGPCEIEGGGVQHADTAGVQLVLAFALECLERNVQYVWKSRSPVFEDAVRILGVGALLECPG